MILIIIIIRRDALIPVPKSDIYTDWVEYSTNTCKICGKTIFKKKLYKFVY